MSTYMALFPHPYLTSYSGPGASPEAEHLERVFSDNQDRLQHDSRALGIADAFRELFDVASDTRLPDWDGYGASPISRASYRNASKLLQSLPLGVPNPSMGVDPDGEVTIEWFGSPNRTLSISVSPDGLLHYSAVIGSSKVYGTEPFFGPLPSRIFQTLYQIWAA